MALRFSKTSSSGSEDGNYDHTLLINRGMPDQHTIESITGLRNALNSKYEKPYGGIPKTDLGFDVATLQDIDNLRNVDIRYINDQLRLIIDEIVDARGDEDTLRKYIDTKVGREEWSNADGSSNGGSVGYPLYHSELASEGQVAIEFGNTYQVGTGRLEVYLNGLLMNLNTDYLETSDHSIEFLFPLETDDRVTAVVRAIITSGIHEEYVAKELQDTFTLVNKYAIYQNLLQVYVNGVLQRKGIDYLEVDDLTIKFKVQLTKGDFVTFHQAGSTDPIAGVVLESEIGRLKISNTWLSLSVQETTGVEQNHGTDSYSDSFLTLSMIDEEVSSNFTHEGHVIKSSLSTLSVDKNKSFAQDGYFAGVDGTSLTNRLILKNEKGSSDIHDFAQTHIEPRVEDTLLDSVRILFTNRSETQITIEQKATGRYHLINKVYREDSQRIRFLESSDSLMDTDDKLSDLTYSSCRDSAYIAFTRTNSEGSAIFIAKVTNNVIEPPVQVTEYVDKSRTPAISYDGTKLVIAFTSRRVSRVVDNIDYVILEDGVFSGINHVTSDGSYPSKSPTVEIMNNEIFIAYSTVLVNGTSFNIRMAKIINDSATSINITNDIYDTDKPKILKGTDGILRIVWLSKRAMSNDGVDFIFVEPSGVTSPIKMIFSGTSSIVTSNVDMFIDHENSAHIVYEANQMSASITNLLYTYVTADNEITEFGNIKNHSYNNVRLGSLSGNLDTVIVSGYTEEEEYLLNKSLANFASGGYYIKRVDSLYEDTEWKSLVLTDYVPVGGTITYRVRVSNDLLDWSSWLIHIAGQPLDLKGRYFEIEAYMTSTYTRSPEIYCMKLQYQSQYFDLYTKPISIQKDIQNAIVIARYTGDIVFSISKDGGETFREATLDRTTNLLSMPSTQEVVLKATIHRDAVIDSWAVIW